MLTLIKAEVKSVRFLCCPAHHLWSCRQPTLEEQKFAPLPQTAKARVSDLGFCRTRDGPPPSHPLGQPVRPLENGIRARGLAPGLSPTPSTARGGAPPLPGGSGLCVGGARSVAKVHTDPSFEGPEKTNLTCRDEQLSSGRARGRGAVGWDGTWGSTWGQRCCVVF